MEAYEPDAFKTLTLRVDRATRTAVPEGLLSLFAGDILTVVVRGVYGLADPSKIVFGIYSEDGDILSSVSGSWAYVPGGKDAVYAAVSLSTGNAAALAGTLRPGRPVTVHISLSESDGRTVMESEMPFQRSLSYSGGGTAGEVSTYVTRSEIAALAAQVAAMPSLNDYDRKRRLEVLLAGLQAMNV